ncbi:sensor histidine kinase [Pedobacter montanisoli]|uniref:Histidine kinase n=1 Tax=Pedobacter montanisoli TaxID=2923277 RepID=A0ABS9ZZ45_9SPHI|nr:histidine kinase [Pedobacter montanisoli]MCJ0743580.1 histidine kinase [Pedobacter montanisoli]
MSISLSNIRFTKVWSLRKKILRHLLFWGVCTTILTFLFAVGLPGYFLALKLVLMLLPVHILYYYTVDTLLIPKYLFKRKFLALALSFIVVCAFYTCLYRLIEIFFADPYLYAQMKPLNPAFKWKKIEGSFQQQFFNGQYMIHALEQSNSIIWGALLIKFIRMWYERKQMALHSELNFLKAQIHPHFLFNTLNNLYALTLDNSPSSPEVVLGLSQILRYMLYECKSDYVPLKRDVEIIKNYITLEKLRHGDRLDLNFKIDGEINQQQIAPLLMIPLIENAFKHGASEMMEGAWINMVLEVNPNSIKFKVSNGKPIEQHENQRVHFGKIGLENVKKRLELIYPETHQFTTYNEEDMYVAILEITLNSASFTPIATNDIFKSSPYTPLTTSK